MRLLVVTPPQLGHVRPPLALVRALAAAHHAVAWATGEDALSHLRPEPVEALRCGLTAVAAREQLRERWPDLARLTPREHGPAMRQRLFGEVIATAMQPELERCIATWRPDAVLHDPLALAAAPVCRAFDVPRLEHAYGWPLPPLLPAGTRGSPAEPELRVEIVPAALRSVETAAAEDEIQCRPFDRRAGDLNALPDEVRDLLLQSPGTPVVLASFGTVFHTRDALRVVAETLAGMRLRSIVLGTDHASLGAAPSARQVCLPWLDQSAVLPFCDAVVSHGGAGTVLGALAHGCPLVLLPQGADHFRNADAVCRARAGCAMDGPLDRGQLQAAIADLVDRRWHTGAQAAARAIEAMPTPAAAADRVVVAFEQFLRTRRANA